MNILNHVQVSHHWPLAWCPSPSPYRIEAGVLVLKLRIHSFLVYLLCSEFLFTFNEYERRDDESARHRRWLGTLQQL